VTQVTRSTRRARDRTHSGARDVVTQAARRMKRAFDNSLREFPSHLAERRELDDVIAIFGNVAFSTAAQTDQLARIAGRYGFERIP
jgi:hypothetical protein